MLVICFHTHSVPLFHPSICLTSSLFSLPKSGQPCEARLRVVPFASCQQLWQVSWTEMDIPRETRNLWALSSPCCNNQELALQSAIRVEIRENRELRYTWEMQLIPLLGMRQRWGRQCRSGSCGGTCQGSGGELGPDDSALLHGPKLHSVSQPLLVS